MVICNACRYCEGYCAVFPAMERRLSFSEADLNYLANLCHNCAECYYSCQYAPPHEFSVNVPKVFAEIRARSYEKYAWPRFLRISAWWALAAGLVVAALLAGTRPAAGADFYSVISHDAMVATFGVITAFIILLSMDSCCAWPRRPSPQFTTLYLGGRRRMGTSAFRLCWELSAASAC